MIAAYSLLTLSSLSSSPGPTGNPLTSTFTFIPVGSEMEVYSGEIFGIGVSQRQLR